MTSKSPLKAAPLRNPGQHLDEELDVLINDKATGYVLMPLMLWAMAGLEWLAAVQRAPRAPGWYAAAALLFSAVGVWKLIQLRESARRLRLGRDGERAVGQFLETMEVESARVFHDVQAEGFNLDHVLVCERGIFVIETKTWSKPKSDSRISVQSGAILRDGQPVNQDPIGQVLGGSSWLTRLLTEGTGRKFQVQSVVVFPGWWVEPMDAATKRTVWVLEPKALPAWIEHAPSTLSREEATLISYFLGRYIRHRQTE